MGRDKPESETVPQHPNLAELDHMSKWNYLPQMFLFNCGISIRSCY